MPRTKQEARNPLNEDARALAKSRGGTLQKAPKRPLNAVQKLRQHVLIELGVDKADIARAVGTTPQTVSNLLLDDHRSHFEEKIVEYLRGKYYDADTATRFAIDRIVCVHDQPQAEAITPETFGWAPKEEQQSAEARQPWILGKVRGGPDCERCGGPKGQCGCPFQ